MDNSRQSSKLGWLTIVGLFKSKFILKVGGFIRFVPVPAMDNVAQVGACQHRSAKIVKPP